MHLVRFLTKVERGSTHLQSLHVVWFLSKHWALKVAQYEGYMLCPSFKASKSPSTVLVTFISSSVLAEDSINSSKLIRIRREIYNLFTINEDART